MFHQNDRDVLHQILKGVRSMETGLASLTTAVSDLSSATTGITTELASISAELKTSEDPAVQAAADKIESLVKTLNDATAAATAAVVPPAPATT
jgi:hypothetical protein